jgi:RNA polymerase sigma-70 factor (ECF subfamily)
MDSRAPTTERPKEVSGDGFQDGIIAAIPKLRAYAWSLLGSAQEVDDLVQESLTRAWRSRETYERGTNLNAWICRILRNEFLDQLPKRQLLVVDLDELMASRLICAANQEWHAQLCDVVAALPRLSSENRNALLMIAAGYSYSEVAEFCACGVDAMKQRVRRARAQVASLADPQTEPGLHCGAGLNLHRGKNAPRGRRVVGQPSVGSACRREAERETGEGRVVVGLGIALKGFGPEHVELP